MYSILRIAYLLSKKDVINLNFSELIHKTWEHENVRGAKIRKSDVKIVLYTFTDILIESLITQGKAKIQSLFTLKIKKVKSRRIANPQNKELMYTDDYYKINIEPSKRLKNELIEMRNKNN